MSPENPQPQGAKQIHNAVRDFYGKVATEQSSCCGPAVSCCGPAAESAARQTSESIGYAAETLDSVPEDANLGLGCGNPTALTHLKPGEVVIDLGAGAGLDALVAARAVGAEGRVIGVDMTKEMLTSARKNAVEMGVHGFVEFREGLIESLPVASDSADVVISNCVINLSPDKPQAFREAYRVLKPGGRLAVSDIVLTEELPGDLAQWIDTYVGCLGGAAMVDAYLGAIEGAGFTDISFTRSSAASLLAGSLDAPGVAATFEGIGRERIEALADTVWSYKITASKP